MGARHRAKENPCLPGRDVAARSGVSSRAASTGNSCCSVCLRAAIFQAGLGVPYRSRDVFDRDPVIAHQEFSDGIGKQLRYGWFPIEPRTEFFCHLPPPSPRQLFGIAWSRNVHVIAGLRPSSFGPCPPKGGIHRRRVLCRDMPDRPYTERGT